MEDKKSRGKDRGATPRRRRCPLHKQQNTGEADGGRGEGPMPCIAKMDDEGQMDVGSDHCVLKLEVDTGRPKLSKPEELRWKWKVDGRVNTKQQ